MMTVDEFVDKKVLPQFKDVVESIRTILREVAPQAQETISYGIPAYKVKKIFAVISPTKKDITLSFTHGAEMEDQYKMLRGKGKISRHIKFKKVETINRDVLEYYIQQALKIESLK